MGEIDKGQVLAALQAHLDPSKRTRVVHGEEYVGCAPRVTCANGVDLSVQTRSSAYCTPRDDVGPWTHVEVGFPSVKIDALMPYAEDPEDPTETVYGWVPLDIVADVVIANGGLAKAAAQ